MTFPDKAFENIHVFADAYFDQLAIASQSVDAKALNEAALMLGNAYDRRAAVYVCGNGGSASIANHLICDHLKGLQTDTNTRPRVMSLSSNIEILTAIANDVSYEDIFTFQLSTMADAGDVLITISSSGESENIVRAAQWAKSNKCSVIAMTGFDGGRSSKLAHINLHVESDNYGVIEDTHQSLMHILAQFLRLDRMENSLIPERRF
ncbi:MAG: phosphoheptose isomerase [Euryarchaeota archaeon]|nr:phosphoheptose isomerase [Euryarchaeota archaeon]|tara:strand:- start:125 stop:745 length:621 start_codon:yes stop_codon:yes gene_type:complete